MYKVIRDVEAEDKLVGPLTLRLLGSLLTTNSIRISLDS